VFPADAAGVYEAARRGGNDILRPRHPGAPLRAGFAGTPAYAPDPRWVIAGRYRPFDKPRDVTVGSVVAGLEHVYAAPGPDGTVTLDFNRAANLPCAYTPFATCPLPSAGNRLPVAVEAGEQIPHEAQASER